MNSASANRIVGNFIGICLIILVSLFEGTAQDISNGSFESGPTQHTYRKGFIGLPKGNTSINRWKVKSGTIDYIGRYWKASDGTYSLDLNGSTAGIISQNFKTTVGQTYAVQFDLAGNPVCTSPEIKTLFVTTGASSETYTFDVSGTSTTDMGWVTQTFQFKATSTTTTIMFMSQNLDSKCGPALDNIRMSDLKYADVFERNGDETRSSNYLSGHYSSVETNL